MIELHELTKRYGDKLAVDGLSFQVPRGVVTGFLGPNGAGKSTTMRLILDLDRPTSGRVSIDAKGYGHLSEPLKYIGALLEAQAVHPGRTAYNHLLWLAQSNRIPVRRVDEVLGLVGLTEVAGKRARGFSLGMRQRLGIASALLGDPEILMFDEPVNGLDPEGILWIRNLMKRLAAEGRTVFVSSHLMSEMALTAEHLVVIGRGRLLADLPMAEFIRRNSRSAVRLRTPHPEQLLDALAAQSIVVEPGPDGCYEVVNGDPAALGDLAASHGVTLHELSLQRASLEEAFMQMTADSVEYHAGAGADAGAGPVQTDAAGAPGAWGAQWQPAGGRPARKQRHEQQQKGAN
ncbi:ABC transporter ATP-binding protein [Kitasatospora sp. NBC_01250]|uniref:ABC transporter ATP-binding protein n=1 Tax=unclassified Kitasatospora TaxID=2633591 RepID=UPI002E119C8A|nr:MULTISPECIES: ABC transporter ATP-binding protein [unclassified Kitasatospora]WSJ69301.1 ABC transporter ATP-binding protein [Kitasatospora sp. NBC_01302]